MGTSPSNNERWIALFDSIHHVIAAENRFKAENVWCDLVPVPRNLSSDCGMAVSFKASDLQVVWAILNDPRIRTRRVYRPGLNGHEPVPDLPLSNE
jgi:hypothetical protein